jgi:hypothetical protein
MISNGLGRFPFKTTIMNANNYQGTSINQLFQQPRFGNPSSEISTRVEDFYLGNPIITEEQPATENHVSFLLLNVG